jgi:hypothetical protein
MEISKVYSGKLFNELNKETKFYKITNKEENHFNFQYQDGLNIDINKFDPTENCKKGGLYFTDLDNIPYFFDYGCWIREVILPDDAQIYVEDRKYKADKIILKEKIHISNFSEWQNIDFCKNSIIKTECSVLQIMNPEYLTEEIYKFIVLDSRLSLRLIDLEKQTNAICELAVQQNGCALEFVKPEFMTEKMCKLAVQQNGLAIQFIDLKMLTEEIYKIAVNQNGDVLRFIDLKDRTDEICKLAVNSR